MSFEADERGYFGTTWGGRFMPEALVAALDELTDAWREAMADAAFVDEFEPSGWASGASLPRRVPANTAWPVRPRPPISIWTALSTWVRSTRVVRR